MKKIECNTRIVLALDVTSREEALHIAEETAEFLDAIKIGYPLILGTDISIITELGQHAPIIADLKIADIPNTNRLICEQAYQKGASAIIAQGFTGEDSIQACTQTAQEYGGEVYVVAEMSHPGGSTLFQPVALQIVEMARDAGAHGLIAPATRPERIQEIKKHAGNMRILCPGVGTQGGQIKETLDAGADHLIIGRTIYNSENPRETVIKIAREIEDTCR